MVLLRLRVGLLSLLSGMLVSDCAGVLGRLLGLMGAKSSTSSSMGSFEEAEMAGEPQSPVFIAGRAIDSVVRPR